ncbi:MAG: glycoside hydrolase family 99-like domain-containing protein [Kiritimatiellae bacterium]|nr:glycoside hydrolase family 99-like domain-containing protein [Kiritimatiellia bacterium]
MRDTLVFRAARLIKFRKEQLIVLFGLTLLAQSVAAPPRELLSWNFSEKNAEQWVAQAHQCKVHIDKGTLKGVTTGHDPFLTSPAFALDATASQVIEFRAKCAAGGKGEIFWLPAGAKSAQQRWSVAFNWVGDGSWHDYRVRPYWQGEKKIVQFRLDFINGSDQEVPFEISSIRILDEAGLTQRSAPIWAGATLQAWNSVDGAKAGLKDGVLSFQLSENSSGALMSPGLALDAQAYSVVAVEMAVAKSGSGTLQWVCDQRSGLHSKRFAVKGDGQYHTYNIDLSGEEGWTGQVVLINLVPLIDKGASAQIRSIRACDDLQGPADVAVLQAGVANAFNRAGSKVPILIQFENIGGQDARNVRLAVKSLPKGVSVCSDPGWEQVAEIPATGSGAHTVELRAEQALSGLAEFTVSGDGTSGQVVQVPLEILPDLKLPKAPYVPQPQPLKSDYEIGALYFPGWSKIEAWARIWKVAPERKPVLGWYDEANPEVVDWQIKWAVENGLSFFMVDWYWNKGHQHHDHWVKAFQKARYRSYLKWAVMWANHNPVGSHSEADQREVAKFWIENYFSMPEYYRIEDQPVVMIWSPQNMNRDLGDKNGCRLLLETSRRLAREAGYKGIYFIAMKWPEATWTSGVVQELKEMGFDMTSIYHFMDHGGKAQDPRRFPFELVAEANPAHWKGQLETGILPFLPNLSTGWDSRPWHGDKGIEIYGRSVELFRDICRNAKVFADESGVKRLLLAPLNEWGEGSYAEPCTEYGFGMYEAIRESLCHKPVAGWPLNIAPSDVGLGPYDLPMPKPDRPTAWSFRTGMHGWSAMMGITGCSTGDAGLSFTTSSHDPALARSFSPIRTAAFSGMVVRMKLPASVGGNCQLFWSSGATPTETTSQSLPLVADGQFHDYAFDLAKARAWRGRVSYLRFDPCNVAGVPVVIDSITLVPAQD